MLTAVSFAYAGAGYGLGRGYGMGPCTASNLDLTAEQSAKLQSVRETYLKDITPLQNQLFSKRAEFRLLWAETNPDRDKIFAKQKEILEIQKQLGEKATQYRLDCRAMLTPEQQSKMAAFGPGMGRGNGSGWKHGGRW